MTAGLPFRSECTCACHKPGVAMVHVQPCCRPDPVVTAGSEGVVPVTLPDVLPGHWTSVGGREMAVRTMSDPNVARSRERISDLALANEVFLSPGIANLTDAKERIRWLSAQLAVANDRLAALADQRDERGGEVALIAELTAASVAASQAHRMMAEAKSARQPDNPDGRTDLYAWPRPEQTLEGRAAAALTASFATATPTDTRGGESALREALEQNVPVGTIDARARDAIISNVTAAFARAALASPAAPGGVGGIDIGNDQWSRIATAADGDFVRVPVGVFAEAAKAWRWTLGVAPQSGHAAAVYQVLESLFCPPTDIGEIAALLAVRPPLSGDRT